MKSRLFFLVMISFLSSCIGTDLVDEPLGNDQSQLQFDENTLALQVGAVLTIDVQFTNSAGDPDTPELVWTSSRPEVASVNPAGSIEALQPGQTAIVAVEVNTDLSDTLFLNIVSDTNALAQIVLTASDSTMAIGDTQSVSAKLLNVLGNPINPGIDLQWNSSDENVLSVNEEGIVTAIAEGQSSISASAIGISSSPLIFTVGDLSRDGVFQGANGYNVSGSVILQDINLVFQSDFASSAGPGLYVYLSNSPSSVSGGVQIGELISTSGMQSYSLPSGTGTNDFDYVIIYCQPFGIPFGFAQLD